MSDNSYKGTRSSADHDDRDLSTRSSGIRRKVSLGAPFWLLVAYFFIEYVRPQDRLPFLAPLRLGFITVILLALVWLAKANKSVLKEPLVMSCVLFAFLAASTVVFAVNTYYTYHVTRALAIYMIAGTLASIAFLETREAIRKFFNLWRPVKSNTWSKSGPRRDSGRRLMRSWRG